MKYKVTYTITGTYTITSDDMSDVLGDLDEEASDKDKLEAITEAINDDPFVDYNPIEDGDVGIKVEQV